MAASIHELNSFNGERNMDDIRERIINCEDGHIASEMKSCSQEKKPNISVRRKMNTASKHMESNSSFVPDEERVLNHLKEHLIVRQEDGGDENNEEMEELPMPPQRRMEPIVPAVECYGIDLTPILQNVVSTVNMGCTLDLQKITFCTRMSEYNPSRFSGVVMRIREPHTTALIFRSGKMVVTGAKTEGEAHLASRKYARIIQKLGFSVRFMDFKIQNIVGTFDVKFPIRVESLNQVHGQFCRYEPELFPGLIYRLVKPRVVLLIFVNGKIVMTGARNRAELKEALHIMYPVLKSFKKEKS